MEKLDSRQHSIVLIAANTATGNLDVLKTALNEGLESGLTVNEIKEVLIQMYAYCGFPRSLQGLTTFMQVVDERKAAGITDLSTRSRRPSPRKASMNWAGRRWVS